MSAPNPSAWHATAEEFRTLTLVLNGPMDDAGVIAADKIIDVFVRRRALAELKALAPSVCRRCAVAYPVAGQFVGDYWHQAEKCQAGRIHDRIAEIEAEG